MFFKRGTVPLGYNFINASIYSSSSGLESPNIKLIGFEEIEPGMLVVVKKVVGNYVKKISEQIAEPKELSLELKAEKSKYNLNVKLNIKDKEYNAEVTDSNLFFAMNNVLNKVVEKAKI